jgi:hypothetical protein
MATIDPPEELRRPPLDDGHEKEDEAPASGPDLGPALTPHQIFGGFALLAGLILVLSQRRRRQRLREQGRRH